MKQWDWIIVGAGMHGSYLGGLLRKYRPHDSLLIIDPHDSLLSVWNDFTSRTGMKFLRSPGSHSLSESYTDLSCYAKKKGRSDEFIEPYNRPSLSLFNDHCEHIISEYQLQDHFLQDEITFLDHDGEFFYLHSLNNNSYYSKNVILAMGISHTPSIPHWAEKLDNITHLFGSSFSLADKNKVAIIGGGISGCQLAIKLAPHKQVTLYNPTPLKERKFDGDPALVGPKLMEDYQKLDSYTERRQWLKKYRYPGTLPWDIFQEVNQCIQDGQVQLELCEINGSNYKELQSFDQVILSTGFEKKVPGQSWLQPFAEKHKLPTAPDGYPIPDKYARWMTGLYLTGPLSELEIGTSALNIQGAHRTGIRILNYLYNQNDIYKFRKPS
ncbi:NAD(P)-binding domain-containing protein [Spirochaeta cellobiosiphila]|uniref:NAD(P)-binding domain-containing protein n=1 Tax=Spirochaeta cellobiosiphila TaxID=504483 RepID=UPI0003F4D8CD|nr:NAD(P)-binding domain-containing protein [Spirochaeta cellobiosiphila]